MANVTWRRLLELAAVIGAIALVVAGSRALALSWLGPPPPFI